MTATAVLEELGTAQTETMQEGFREDAAWGNWDVGGPVEDLIPRSSNTRVPVDRGPVQWPTQWTPSEDSHAEAGPKPENVPTPPPLPDATEIEKRRQKVDGMAGAIGQSFGGASVGTAQRNRASAPTRSARSPREKAAPRPSPVDGTETSEQHPTEDYRDILANPTVQACQAALTKLAAEKSELSPAERTEILNTSPVSIIRPNPH